MFYHVNPSLLFDFNRDFTCPERAGQHCIVIQYQDKGTVKLSSKKVGYWIFFTAEFLRYRVLAEPESQPILTGDDKSCTEPISQIYDLD